METLEIYIRRNLQESRDWGTNKVEFENGIAQYQQKYTEPTVTYTFQTEGGAQYIQGILDFFDARKGMYETFYCDLFRDGNKKIYRFGSASLEPEWHYDLKQKVGATLDITLILEKGQESV